MAGSHRAPGPPKRSPTARGVVGAVVVALVITGVWALTRPDSDGQGPSQGPTPTPATPTPTSLPTVVITPTATPTATPTRHAVAGTRVPVAAPRRIEIAGVVDVGFDSTVTPRNGVFAAASTAEVARWGSRGLPGNPGKDTVYVIGKITSGGAFARLSRVHTGTRVTLRTNAGVLTYTVRSTLDRPARGLSTDPTFARHVSGRLQLVGIRYNSADDRTGRVLVVTAELTAARRAS